MEYCVTKEDDHQSLCNKDNDYLEEEEDHPSCCDENYDHLEKEYVADELSNVFHDESQAIVDHILKGEIIENFLFPDHSLAQNTHVRGDVEDDIIEFLLESID